MGDTNNEGGMTMAEKKCRYCARMIPQEAKVCPHCRKRQGTSTGVKVLAVIFILIGIGMCQSLTSKKATYQAEHNQPVTVNAEPVLELQKWHWYTEYDYAIAEGTVKNISSESLDNVEAVLQVYDKQGNFIKSDSTLIEYRPILPGQISPFKVMSSFNPAMGKASIDFKNFSGGTLSWREKELKKK
jgi:hypothetical protein